MANGNIVVGVDVGTSAVSTVVLESGKKGRSSGRQNSRFRILGVGRAPSQGMRRGYVADFDDVVTSVRASIREAEKSAGIPIKRVYLGFGGIGLGAECSKGTVAVSRADHEISDSDVKRVISQSETNLSNVNNKQIIHTIPLYFLIDKDLKTTRPIGMKGGKLEAEVFFVTCLSQHLDDLVKSVEAAGVVVDDAVASPLAASRIVLGKQQKEAGCLLADFGAGTVSLMVFEEGLPISLEVFPLGSSHITSDIALGLQLSLEDAEVLKISFGSDNFSKKKLSDIVEARLNDIFELIEGHLKKNNRNRLLPGGVILTGGGANLVNLADLSKSYLGLPVTIGVIKELPGKESLTNSHWSTALGVCLFGAEDASSPKIDLETALKTKNILLRWFRSFLP